jgi:hypothetical protein
VPPTSGHSTTAVVHVSTSMMRCCTMRLRRQPQLPATHTDVATTAGMGTN